MKISITFEIKIINKRQKKKKNLQKKKKQIGC